MTKHSPGHWDTPRDKSHATAFGYAAYEVGPLGITVATINTSVSEDEQQANARLIAAAPAMLEALQRIAAITWRHDRDNGVTAIAREAIALATDSPE